MPITNLRTPAGRIVWGDPSRSTIKKDQRTKQPVLKDGKPVEQWAFGIAFPKEAYLRHTLAGNPNLEQIVQTTAFERTLKPAFDQEAASAYPHGVPQGFSWKYKDGDGVDRAGKPYSAREGYAGHYVLNVSTEAYAPPIFKFENGAYRQISQEEIKTGDFAALSLNVKVNVPTNPTHTPGLYVNPDGIEWLAYGALIQNSANPEDMFGGGQTQHYLPPTASTTPVSSAPTGQQPYQQPPQQQPQQQYQPQQQPQQQYQPQQQPQQQYQPQQQQQPYQQPQQQQPYQQPQQQQPYQQPQQQQQQQQQPQQQQQQQQQPNNGYPPPATGFVDNAGQPMPGQMPQR
jgi:hypothetical protein